MTRFMPTLTNDQVIQRQVVLITSRAAQLQSTSLDTLEAVSEAARLIASSSGLQFDIKKHALNILDDALTLFAKELKCVGSKTLSTCLKST